MMFSFVAAAAATILLTTSAPTTVDVSNVVVVGDSVLWFGADEAAVAHPGWLFDTVPGREPSDAASSWEAASDAVSQVEVGGWLVFQDYAVDTTVEEWEAGLLELVAVLPDDRCLAFVTSFLADPSAVAGRLVVDTTAHSEIMREVIVGQPCHAVIDWEQAATVTSSLVGVDGVHPTVAGTTWLYEAIAYETRSQ